MNYLRQYALGGLLIWGLFSCNSMNEQPSSDTLRQDARRTKIEKMERLYQEYGWTFTPKSQYTREECFLLMDYDSVKRSLSEANRQVASLNREARIEFVSNDRVRVSDIKLEVPSANQLPLIRYLDLHPYLGRSPWSHISFYRGSTRCDFSIAYDRIQIKLPTSNPMGDYVTGIGKVYLRDAAISDSGSLYFKVDHTNTYAHPGSVFSILALGHFVLEGFFGENTIPAYAHAAVGLRKHNYISSVVGIVGQLVEVQVYRSSSKFYLPPTIPMY